MANAVRACLSICRALRKSSSRWPCKPTHRNGDLLVSPPAVASHPGNWHHFECKFLPSYSPDFNPIERLWLRLKADYFSNFIARSTEELNPRLCFALNAIMDDHPKVASQ